MEKNMEMKWRSCSIKWLVGVSVFGKTVGGEILHSLRMGSATCCTFLECSVWKVLQDFIHPQEQLVNPTLRRYSYSSIVVII